jgi:protein-disulfide isomerase
MAAGAAGPNRLWSFADAFCASQGQENTGYVTDEFLREIGASAGLDVDAALGETGEEFLTAAESSAQEHAVESTPSFVLRTGDDELPVDVKELTPEAFTTALDEALAR